MPTLKKYFSRTCAVLILLGLVAFPASGAAQSGQFAATGSTLTARYAHTATQLSNGKVLITGGATPYTYLTASELYDPASGTFSATGSLNTSRLRHTATALPNGKVLVAGGQSVAYDITRSAELYDPQTGTFSPAGNLITSRDRHSATLLPNGKVLFVGGFTDRDYYGSPTALAEIYDPATGAFTATGSLSTGRCQHTATLLPNGKVLIAGGLYWNGASYATTSSAELYDPEAGTFSAAGAMNSIRNFHSATLLANGTVLLAGGNQGDGGSGPNTASAEIYDPATSAFATTGSLVAGRTQHTATLLPNGRVLVAGGDSGLWPLSSAEMFDPATLTFAATTSMIGTRSWFTATLLTATGKVLVAAGYSSPDHTTSSAELYGNPLVCY